ncbi:FecR domain-containing protein [bacterium]|nr:FecR domain-containing protein [bacterium]
MNIKIILLLLLFINIITFSHANVIGKLIPLEGFSVIHGTPEIQVTKPTDLNTNDRISTGKGVTAKIILTNGTSIKLKENTELAIHKSFIKVKRGNSTFTFHKSGKKFKIFTPTVLLAVYGTEFIVEVSPAGDSVISLLKGKVEVTALSGNKNSSFLKPGESINGTKTGLSEVFKTKLVLNNRPDESKSIPVLDEESEEIEEENLEMNGNLRCFIKVSKNNPTMDVTSYPWLLKVNGYNKFNGKQLSYSGQQKAFINKLEPGYYDFSLIISGSEYTFPYDINPKTSGSTIKLFIERFLIKFSVGDMEKYLTNDELSKFIRIFVSNGDIRNQIYFKFQNTENKSSGYQVSIRECNQIGIGFPVEKEMPSLIELFYTGDAVTSRKHIKIIPIKNKYLYDVKF